MNQPQSSSEISSDTSTRHLTLRFCGSRCWKPGEQRSTLSGKEVVQQLAAMHGVTKAELLDDGATIKIEGICDLSIEKAKRCLGSCGLNPAARIVEDGAPDGAGPPIRAASPEAIQKELADYVQEYPEPRGW